MPCTRLEEQAGPQGSLPVIHRSTFSRAFAGLRFSNQQDLQSFAAYHRHSQEHVHPSVVPQQAAAADARQSNSNVDDLTEQIRISVQDTLMGQNSLNDIGGNISNVLDSFEESILAFDNSQLPQAQQNSDSSVDSNNGIAVEQPMPGQSGNHTSLASSPSTSSSTINPGRMVDVKGSQQHASSNLYQGINHLVMGNIRGRNNAGRTSSQQKATEVCSIRETKKSESEWSTSESDWFVNDTTSEPNDRVRTKKSSRTFLITSDEAQQRKTDEKGRNCSSSVRDQTWKRLTLVDALSVCRLVEPQISGITKCSLSNGSSFSGYQQSTEASYDVNVKIQYVDFEQSYLYGYLCISHLTPSLPTLTTFFEGEIVSQKYPFQTRKWDATSNVDLDHWSRLDGFSSDYAHLLATDKKDHYEELKNSDYIFMRWKERFLFPDHTIKYVDGASYAGFYYISFNKRTSQIQGYYYHITEMKKDQKFQSLVLNLDGDERSTQSFEFR